jgi:hypothetical protein
LNCNVLGLSRVSRDSVLNRKKAPFRGLSYMGGRMTAPSSRVLITCVSRKLSCMKVFVSVFSESRARRARRGAGVANRCACLMLSDGALSACRRLFAPFTGRANSGKRGKLSCMKVLLLDAPRAPDRALRCSCRGPANCHPQKCANPGRPGFADALDGGIALMSRPVSCEARPPPSP